MWEPTASPQPAPSEPATASRSGWIVPIAAIALGLVADQVLDGPPGLGVFLVIAATAAGLVLLARPTLVGAGFAVGAIVVGGFVVVRASVPLVLLDLVVAAGLLCWASGFARATGIRGSARVYLRRGVGVLGSPAGGVRMLAAPSVHTVRTVDGPQVRAIGRSLVVTVPVVGVLLLLLASADAVYAHLVTSVLPLSRLGELPRHLVVTAVVAVGFASLVAYATHEAGFEDRPVRRLLGPTEWKTVLVGVDLLFVSFVVVQAATLFGGREHLLAETGLSVAEYARSGFFQLLAVAAITCAVLVSAASFGRRAGARDARIFTVLAATMIVLTLAILASSFQRLALYEQDFGFTWLRLAVHTTIIVLAAMLACGLVAVLLRRATWLPAAIVVIGLAGVLGLNAIDPDAFIAEHNLARAARGHDLDVAVLGSLSADASPTLLEALPSLRAQDVRPLGAALACTRDDLAQEVAASGWPSFNGARDRGLEALLAAGLGSCPA